MFNELLIAIPLGQLVAVVKITRANSPRQNAEHARISRPYDFHTQFPIGRARPVLDFSSDLNAGVIHIRQKERRMDRENKKEKVLSFISIPLFPVSLLPSQSLFFFSHSLSLSLNFNERP